MPPQTPPPSRIVTPPPPNSGAPLVPPAKKRNTLAIILVIIGVLLIAAGGYFWWRSHKKTTTKTTTAVVKHDVQSLTYSTVGGTFNLFYPAEGVESNASTFEFNQQVFETLVQYQDLTQIKPVLADSWSNPDDKTWIFNLKQNVKFHDGNTLSAKDIKYSLEQAKPSEELGAYVDTLKDITVVSPTKVQITTTVPDALLLAKLTNLFIYDSTPPKGAKDGDTGTGPYMVKPNTTPSANKVSLTAFGSYHGGRIYTRNLTFTTSNQDASADELETNALAALKKGDVNLIGPISPTKAATVKKSNYTQYNLSDLGVRLIGFNVSQAGSPLQKLKVRQAVYSAIDVPTLLKAINISQNAAVATQMVTADVPGYNPDIKRMPYDVAKAKALLTEAGYPNGFNLTISILSAPEGLATELTRQLKLAGINATIDEVNDSDQFNDDVLKGKVASWSLIITPSVLDASDIFKFFIQTEFYNPADISGLNTQSNETFNPAARLKLLKEISKRTMDDVETVPLYTQKPIWVADKPYVLTQDTMNGDIGVYFYKVYLK